MLNLIQHRIILYGHTLLKSLDKYFLIIIVSCVTLFWFSAFYVNMRNRLWNELTQSRHNLEFVTLYCERQRKVVKYFNILILVFSSTGIMGWKFWDNLPLISCIIISGISLLKLLQPHLIGGMKQINDIDEIQRFYTTYFNKIEELWFSHESEEFDERKCKKTFYRLKEQETEYNKMISQNIRSKPKNLIRKAKIYSDNYFSEVFNS